LKIYTIIGLRLAVLVYTDDLPKIPYKNKVFSQFRDKLTLAATKIKSFDLRHTLITGTFCYKIGLFSIADDVLESQMEVSSEKIERNFSKNCLLAFFDRLWIKKRHNIVITEPAGVGKNFITTALAIMLVYMSLRHPILISVN